jgi:hypothetical protein
MFGDERPARRLVLELSIRRAGDEWRQRFGGGAGVGVRGADIAADRVEKALELRLGVIKAPRARPAVGTAEDGVVAVS